VPTFVYEGSGHSLSLAGRSLTRGIPINLEGRAAEAAASHPDIRAVGASGTKQSPPKKAPTALAEFAAIKARAKELGLPATGKKADLEGAIKAEEQRLAGVVTGS
jgi:hypothetical protein